MPRTTPISPGRTPTPVPCRGLRAAIARAGLKPSAAAKLAKLGRTRVANWLAEGQAPRVPLERLCRALGTTVDAVAEPPTEKDAALERLRLAERRAAAVEAELRLAMTELYAARAGAEATGVDVEAHR